MTCKSITIAITYVSFITITTGQKKKQSLTWKIGWGMSMKYEFKIVLSPCWKSCFNSIQCIVSFQITFYSQNLCANHYFYNKKHVNSSWPHAFARIIARERRASHGPKSRDCWSPGEPARVQPPFPQDIWTLSSSVIILASIGAGVLVRIWSISNH